MSSECHRRKIPCDFPDKTRHSSRSSRKKKKPDLRSRIDLRRRIDQIEWRDNESRSGAFSPDGNNGFALFLYSKLVYLKHPAMRASHVQQCSPAVNYLPRWQHRWMMLRFQYNLDDLAANVAHKFPRTRTYRHAGLSRRHRNTSHFKRRLFLVEVLLPSTACPFSFARINSRASPDCMFVYLYSNGEERRRSASRGTASYFLGIILGNCRLFPRSETRNARREIREASNEKCTLAFGKQKSDRSEGRNL